MLLLVRRDLPVKKIEQIHLPYQLIGNYSFTKEKILELGTWVSGNDPCLKRNKFFYRVHGFHATMLIQIKNLKSLTIEMNDQHVLDRWIECLKKTQSKMNDWCLCKKRQFSPFLQSISFLSLSFALSLSLPVSLFLSLVSFFLSPPYF